MRLARALQPAESESGGEREREHEAEAERWDEDRESKASTGEESSKTEERNERCGMQHKLYYSAKFSDDSAKDSSVVGLFRGSPRSALLSRPLPPSR